MFRAKWGTSEANQALATAYHSNRTTPMVRCKGWRQRTPIPRRRSLRWARRTGRYVVVRLSPIIFCPRRQCAAVDGETSRSGCRGKGQRIGFCVLAHRRAFLADVWDRGGGWRNRCARHERPHIRMEKFALTNLINTNEPKGRPSSLANRIRQRHAWKRRDRSCWPIASVSQFGSRPLLVEPDIALRIDR
jgi:hypothetical protein